MNPTTRSNIGKKVRSGRRRRMGKSIGRRFLSELGFGDYLEARDEENQRANKLGIFGQAAKKQTDKGIDLPVLDTPEQVTKETSPSVSTIVKQLEALLKTANKIGAISNKQHKALVDQITQAKRLAKETQMESNVPTASPESAISVDGNAISPLASIFDKLTQEIERLTEIIEEKNKEDEVPADPIGVRGRFLDSLGFGDYRKQARKEYLARNQYTGWNSGRKLSDLSVAERDVLKSKGYTFTKNNRIRGPNNKFAGSNDVERSLRQVHQSQLKRPGILGRAVSRTGSAVKSGAAGVAALIGGTAKRSAANAAKAINTGVIKRAARPIITRALGRTAVKSIPIIGAIAGVGFAVKRLIDGDPVGAGLEATSGLAGPLTAIPALVALTARDIYSDIYGIAPEQDPEVGARMSVVTDGVKGVVQDVLGQSVEPKSSPTGDIAAAASGLPVLQRAQQQIKAETPTGAPPVSSPPTRSPTGAGGGGAPISGGGATQQNQPAPATMPNATGQKQPEASGTPSNMPVSNENPYPNAENAVKQKTEPTVGAAIAEASQLNDNLAAAGPQIVFQSGQGAPMPSITPTSRTGAIGMGNVPDPTYFGAGDILAQLYFGAPA